jgi:hypothetical protein
MSTAPAPSSAMTSIFVPPRSIPIRIGSPPAHVSHCGATGGVRQGADFRG